MQENQVLMLMVFFAVLEGNDNHNQEIWIWMTNVAAQFSRPSENMWRCYNNARLKLYSLDASLHNTFVTTFISIGLLQKVVSSCTFLVLLHINSFLVTLTFVQLLVLSVTLLQGHPLWIAKNRKFAFCPTAQLWVFPLADIFPWRQNVCDVRQFLVDSI